MHREKALEAAGLIAVLGAALIIYKGAFAGFFVQDDFGWLESTRFSTWSAYFESFCRFNPARSYRPLSQETFFWLGQKAFGLWPPGFHAVSLLAHFAGAVILYLLLRQFCGVVSSLVGSLFYAVHGAHFRSVYWISAVPEPMAFAFYACSLFLFVRFDRTNRRVAYFLSVAAMALGLMSKESILSLPLVLASYCWLFARGRLVWTSPFFFMSGVYMALRFASHSAKSAPYPLTFGREALGNLQTYLTWSAGLTETVLKGKLGWPSSNAHTLVALLFVAVTLLLLGGARNRRVAGFSLVWFVMALQPVLYFREHIDPYYLAPSLAAVALLIASALPPRGLRTWSAWLPAFMIGLFSLWAAYASVRREGRWWNERTYVGRDILALIPEVDKQVPEDKIAYIFGFTRDDFGVMQEDSLLKAYGFSPNRFICMGLDPDHPRQIRALHRGGGLSDYYCFVFSRHEFFNTTSEFRRNPEHFLTPIEFDVTPREVRRGHDVLRLKVGNFQVPEIDVLYSLDEKVQAPVLHWQLNSSWSIEMPVDGTTRPGLYDFRAIRDSRDPCSTAWYPVNVQVMVR